MLAKLSTFKPKGSAPSLLGGASYSKANKADFAPDTHNFFLISKFIYYLSKKVFFHNS